MKPGRKDTPTGLKKLRGNPGKRALPKNEPQPESDLLGVKPPSHLSHPAKTEWRRLAPQLIRLGLLTVNDLAAFAAYCSAWGDFVEADRALQRDGLVVVGKESQKVRSPWVLVKARAVDQLIKLGDRFGLSPSARAGLGTPTRERDLGVATDRPAGSALAAYLANKPDRLD